MKWLLLLFLCAGISATAQYEKIDPLKQRLKASPEDTGKVQILNSIGRWYTYYDPDSALLYFRDSYDLANKLNYQLGESYSLLYAGEVLAIQGNYYRAEKNEFEAYYKAIRLKNEELLSYANMYLGNLYGYQGNFRHALNFYSKSIPVDKTDSGFEEAIKGLKARAFLETNQLDSAFVNAKRAFDIEGTRRPMTWILPAVTLAAILSKQGKTDSALKIYKTYRNALPDSKSIVEMTIPMAKIMFEKKQTDSAIFYLKKTISSAVAKDYLEEGIEATGILADIYKSEPDLDSAYAYLSLHNLLRDRLLGLNKDREIQNEQNDYKLYNDDIQKTQLKFENKIRIYEFSAAIIIFLVLTVFLWRNNQHKKNEFSLLSKQKHDEKLNLQNEFQQTLLHTQLEIQEQTLKDISQEIHDNIGQILSLAKLNLGTVEINNESESREKIDDSKNLITKAIQDLRDLAKGLNAEYIKTAGLAKSTEHELQKIKKAGHFETIFETAGEPYKLETQKELILFRMVQEIFTNIIRHAKAGLIVVKLNYEPGWFSLKIQDNGQGFDTLALNTADNDTAGLGIKNMLDRAQIIGAKLNIISSAGQGTTVEIKLPFPA